MPRPFASLLVLALVAPPANAQTTAIVGTTLIDDRGGPPVSPATILITDGRIQAVGPSASVRVPAGARRIDGAGKFVIPGLMDANVHLVFGIAKTADRFPPRVPWVGLLRTADQNERRLIAAHAPLLLAADAGITDPDAWAALPNDQKIDNSTALGSAHFTWFDAMAEKGMAPMDMILAATRNIAMAYHVIDDFGTVEPGKRADLLLLDADPLADIANVRKISMVMKDGAVVDREALPLHPMLTVPRS